ncbi:PKD domain-containing protein [Myxococcus qinghaiensis]|uniref:PKD domain-containing protein n=1 Tax=Myxococcus qinghaiensis TaxID=2906758 RepID=UPI0020A827D8|nr:PKD domain-containing protein [Myxococcus qinghaiensis]MCP3166401.1 PKD domain-containing protein [Myxococcus qinghaiensis]
MSLESHRRRRGTLVAVVAGAAGSLLLGLAFLCPPRDGAATESRRPMSPVTVAPSASVVEPRTAIVSTAPMAGVPMPASASGEALAAALNEERVVLASGAVIERLEMDRPWACAGGQVSLAGKVGGAPESGALSRWVWPGSGSTAELHPGARLQWRAPAEPGTYFVRFQVCKDLGGRRVGVLAEQVLRIEVRDCAGGVEPEVDRLEISVTQRANGAFLFRAVPPESESLTGYAWDFGDGRTVVTSGPDVEHAYDTRTLESLDVRTFTVRLTAGRRAGAGLSATAFVGVRGQPPSDEPPPATLTLSRTRGDPEEWRSEVSVGVPGPGVVTWERVERLTLHWDDQVEVVTREWRQVITVEEELGQGGFRGFVVVRPAELAATVKQVVDVLHGRDESGAEVSLSWAAFKREAPPVKPSAEARLPLK